MTAGHSMQADEATDLSNRKGTLAVILVQTMQSNCKAASASAARMFGKLVERCSSVVWQRQVLNYILLSLEVRPSSDHQMADIPLYKLLRKVRVFLMIATSTSSCLLICHRGVAMQHWAIAAHLYCTYHICWPRKYWVFISPMCLK